MGLSWVARRRSGWRRCLEGKINPPGGYNTLGLYRHASPDPGFPTVAASHEAASTLETSPLQMPDPALQSVADDTGRRRRGVVALAVGVGVLVVVFGLLVGGLQFVGSDEPVRRGEAPDFTLTGFDGGTLTLSELRGKVVVVNVWASWCLPCRDEAPYLERVWRRYRDRGVVVVGVAYADRKEPARAFLEEFDITYFNGPDVGAEIARAYNIQGVPETFFVGKDGQLRGMSMGALRPPMLERRLEELLAEPDPSPTATASLDRR